MLSRASLVGFLGLLLLSCKPEDGPEPGDTDDTTDTDTEVDTDDTDRGPTGFGACCLIDASCRNTTADTCDDLGGTLTSGSSCAALTCPEPTVDDIERAGRDLELALRDDLRLYRDITSIVGREYWDLNGDDPARTNELLGREGATLDPDHPLVTEPFLAQYRFIQHAERLVRAVEDHPELTVSEINAATGYARTLQAHALLLVLSHQYTTGILPLTELDAVDPDAAFLGTSASLQYIADLLDESATLLTNGGASFPWLNTLALGFDTPATLRQVNRALSARVRIYLGDKSGSISGIAGSFFNINGDMQTGPGLYYDLQTPNPYFLEPDEDLLTAHPDWVDEASVGDLRVAYKTREYVPTASFFVPVAVEGLVGDRQVDLAEHDMAPLQLIRNEELILIYAEAQIGSDANEVLAAVNRVRNAAGLGNYLGSTSDAALLSEVLRQRRYSLFGEGHRWVDLRRLGRLDEITADRVGDVVHTDLPRPGPDTLARIAEL